jgi:carboxyl-terminal processing protease
MTKPRTRFALAILLAMVISACSGNADPAADSTVVTREAPAGGSEAVRDLQMSGCEHPLKDVEIVCQAYELIHRNYVDQVSDAELAEAASRGVTELDGSVSHGDLACAAPTDDFGDTCELALDEAENAGEAAEAMVAGLAKYALDPNSVYLDREALDLLDEEQDGEIQGIGALVSAEDNSDGIPGQCAIISETCRLSIISTITDSPADKAGLLPGDIIVGVDGADISGWTVDEVTATVRGPTGTEVSIEVLRDDKPLTLAITRADVVIPVVESQTVGDAGYVKLNLFTDGADEQFEEAISRLLGQGVDSLVVDLRDNPGGLLDTAIEVTSVFLADGDVVVTQGPDTTTSYEVSGRSIVPSDLEVVFVVNKGSASASEVVSAVLQERGRATVVGENTFGKNTVQQRFGLANGGALKLTIARWVTPGGLDFGGVGVEPDVEKELGPGLSVDQVVDEALTASLAISGGRSG